MGKRKHSQSRLKGQEESVFLFAVNLFFSVSSIHPHIVWWLPCSASLAQEYFLEHFSVGLCSRCVPYQAVVCICDGLFLFLTTPRILRDLSSPTGD